MPASHNRFLIKRNNCLFTLTLSMDNISLPLQSSHSDHHETYPNRNAPPPPTPPQPPHTAMLHSVRKNPAKPWKHPEPPPPKVYHVSPKGFRTLVQKLTSANSNPRPQREMLVPPPLLALPPPQAFDGNKLGFKVQAAKPVMTPQSSADSKGFMGQLSPSMCSPYSTWCSFPLLSPGTMASLELSNNPIV